MRNLRVHLQSFKLPHVYMVVMREAASQPHKITATIEPAGLPGVSRAPSALPFALGQSSLESWTTPRVLAAYALTVRVV